MQVYALTKVSTDGVEESKDTEVPAVDTPQSTKSTPTINPQVHESLDATYETTENKSEKEDTSKMDQESSQSVESDILDNGNVKDEGGSYQINRN